MKTLANHINESFLINESNEEERKKLAKYILSAADDASWFAESSNKEIKNAEKALEKALKKITNFNKIDAMSIALDIVDEWSYDGDEEAVASLVKTGIKNYK